MWEASKYFQGKLNMHYEIARVLSALPKRVTVYAYLKEAFAIS